MKYAYSYLKNQRISAIEAHKDSLSGINDAFTCINEDCSLSLICTHYGKQVTSRQRVYFRREKNTDAHTGKNCRILNLFDRYGENNNIDTFVLSEKKEHNSTAQQSDTTRNSYLNLSVHSQSKIYGSFQQLLLLIENEISIDIKIKGHIYNSLTLPRLLEQETIKSFQKNLNVLKLYVGDFFVRHEGETLVFISRIKLEKGINNNSSRIKFRLNSHHHLFSQLLKPITDYKQANGKDIVMKCSLLASGTFYKYQPAGEIIYVPNLKPLNDDYIFVELS